MAEFSGTGEYIIRANFARKLGDALNQFSDKESDESPPDPHDVLNRALIEFWGASFRKLRIIIVPIFRDIYIITPNGRVLS